MKSSCWREALPPFSLSSSGLISSPPLIFSGYGLPSARWQLAMIALLLGEGATRAKKIISEYTPTFQSKEAYLAYLDTVYDSGDRIEYAQDGTARVRFD
jgi:hypothetical protein